MNNWSSKLLKDYELQERIGAGGFGAVYKAHQTAVGREVAVKIILPDYANQPDFIRRFEMEAQVIAQLEHPYVVPLYDYWRDPDGAYLVMRFLRGGSLHDALKDGPYDLQSVSVLLDQICSALALVHRNDIVHRDLKPSNILLDEDGNNYLGDFGIAKVLKERLEPLTKTDSVIGSLDYISPEQARGEPVTPRTDIYSLGVVLYEMLVGEHPFVNFTSIERLYKHINDPLPPIKNLATAVQDEMNAIVQKATAKDPALRYSDVLALAVAFRETAQLGTTAAENVIEQLTIREQEVLYFIADGLSNKEIASNLFVSEATVKWHIKQLYRKLGVRSRVQAMIRAQELNLIVGHSDDSDLRVLPAPLTDLSQLPEPENPYKGLRPFQSADHRDFFGREDLVDRLISRMSENARLSRFLAIVGPSGSGKSSLVKAGLIPALWRGDIPGSDRWFVVDMLPGSHPLDELEVALTRVASTQVGNLHEHLQRDERGLLRVAGLILPNDGSELVLIVDQFEELFTLVDQENERTQFLNLLRTAVSEPRSRVRVVITLRADYYDRPLHYPDFGDLVRTSLETILPLNADGLARAISRPAERVGVKFEEGLVTRIVGEINYQAGALPLLQYALTELFERREGRFLTLKGYQEIGGSVGALANRAEDVFLSQSENGRKLAQQMFLRLVTLGEGLEDTRRRAPRSELLLIASDSDLMDEIVDTYADYRLLTLDNDPISHAPTVEVAHEAILREWERLRAWLDENRADMRQQRLLAVAARDWRNSNGDLSYLLTGTRLAQFENWAPNTSIALTPDERGLLDASIFERNRQVETEYERQQRELTLQKRAANQLRYLAIWLAIFLIVAIGLLVFALGKQHDAEEARTVSDARAVRIQELALVNGARAALQTNDLDTALVLATTANEISAGSNQAQHILSEVAYRSGTTSVFDIQHHAWLTSVSLSPNGQMAVSGGSDGKVILWNSSTGEMIRQIIDYGSSGADWAFVRFSPDGHSLLIMTRDGALSLWDVATGTEIRQINSIPFSCTSQPIFSPDGQRVAMSNGGAVRDCPDELKPAQLIIWDTNTGQVLHTFQGYEDAIMGTAFSPDGSKVLSILENSTLVVSDAESGEIILQFGERRDPTPEDWLSDVMFTPDGKMALTSWTTGTTALWDMETYQRLQTYATSTSTFMTELDLSSDGLTLIAGGDMQGITQWDLQTGALLASWPGNAQNIDLANDGHTALVGMADGTLRYVDLQNGALVRRFPLRQAGWGPLDISPDGTRLLTCVEQGEQPCTVVLVDANTGEEIRRFAVGNGGVPDAHFSTDGHLAILSSGDPLTRVFQSMVWNVDTGEIISHFTPKEFPIVTAISPDSQTVVFGDRNGLLIWWKMSTGKEIARAHANSEYIRDMVFSRDGHMLLTGSQDSVLILWDATTHSEIRRFNHGAIVEAVDISSDGRLALSGGDDNIVRLWDTATGQEIRRFVGHTNVIEDAHFSQDGRTIFSIGGENLIQWNIYTGDAIRVYPGGAYFFVPSPDGRSLFTLNVKTDSAIYRWRIDSGDELLNWIRQNRYVRDLTCEERALYTVEPLCKTDDDTLTSVTASMG